MWTISRRTHSISVMWCRISCNPLFAMNFFNRRLSSHIRTSLRIGWSGFICTCSSGYGDSPAAADNGVVLFGGLCRLGFCTASLNWLARCSSPVTSSILLVIGRRWTALLAAALSEKCAGKAPQVALGGGTPAARFTEPRDLCFSRSEPEGSKECLLLVYKLRIKTINGVQ